MPDNKTDTESILIASDHGGFKLKETLKRVLEKEYTFVDLGTSDEKSVDYPDFAITLAQKISRNEYLRGILVCGTGIGMSIAANRFRGVRAAIAVNETMARLSVEHNNANVLCLGERIIGEALAIDTVKKWLSSSFEGDRHSRRLEKIEKI